MIFICHADGCQTKIPFVIMTSDDTNALTIKLLESNSYFGMEPSQVKLLKQVPLLLCSFHVLVRRKKCFYICKAQQLPLVLTVHSLPFSGKSSMSS